MAENPQSVSIVSSERMGASSLLHHICKVAGPAQNEDVIFIYVDMQAMETHSKFIHKVLGFFDEWGFNYEAFDDALQERRDNHLILCLDHFENTLSKPDEFDVGFFDFLRSCLNQFDNLALITVTSKPLKNLSIPYTPGVGSPFQHIFQTQLVLKHWSKQDREIFIRDGFEKTEIKISNDEISFIIENAGESPYHLVVFCDHFYREKVKKKVDYKAIKKAYYHDVEWISGKKKKSGKEWLQKHVIQVGLSLLSLFVVLIWGVFGLARASTSFVCMDNNSENLFVYMEYPKYLALG